MKRVLLLAVAAVGVFAGCAHALAAVTEANVSLTVDERAGVVVVTPLVLPTVSTIAVTAPVSQVNTPASTPIGGTSVSGAAVAAATTTTTTTGGAPVPLSNATLTIYGQAGDAVSMAVPESIQVVRTGGTETLTVKTNTNSQFNLGGNGVALGGQTAEAMSVNVGGSVALASADNLVPGPYEGLLVVVVQYN